MPFLLRISLLCALRIYFDAGLVHNLPLIRSICSKKAKKDESIQQLLDEVEQNGSFNPLPPSDVLVHFLLSETIFSPLPLRTA